MQLAEETLTACRSEPSPDRRRVMVASAMNHLRQVLAATLPGRLPWWTVELHTDLLVDELRRHPDPVQAVRLQLGVTVARLAEGNVTGNPMPADELIETVARFRDEPLLTDSRLLGLVGGFVDLATAQESPPAAPVDRLILAIARRRARAQVERDLGAALRDLEPLLRTLGAGHAHPYIHDLFQTVGRLPDGRDHAVVYADLLNIVPAQLRCFATGELLPGALVEVVAEPAVSVHLRQCARTLEADLVHSPFGSDTALIGQVAHVFQELAEEHAGLDGTVVARTDEAALRAPAPGEGTDMAAGGPSDATTGGTAVNPTRAVRALVGAALDPEGPATTHDLVRTFAQVTGSLGAVLWEAPDGRCAPAGLSIVSLWLDVPSSSAVFEAEIDADPVTALAFDTRTLAVPDDVPDRSAALVGLDVTGALPIDYVDGCSGVLTLLGKEPLVAVFDTVVELVDVLPELCSTVRERQTLALVKACDTILHDADVESPERPLPRRQLAELLSDVCGFIAFELHAAEVSVFLEDSAQPPGRYALFAHSNGARTVEPRDPRQRICIATDPADRTGFDPATGAPFMEVRLLSGTHVDGLVRCVGAEGPPHHFTTSDLALLRPVAAQLSRYWRTWQHRWELSEENESWRRLAAGMTSLNKLVAEELGRTAGDGGQEQRVAAHATQIICKVVPESTVAVAYRTCREGRRGRACPRRAHGQRDRGRGVPARRADGAGPPPTPEYPGGRRGRLADLYADPRRRANVRRASRRPGRPPPSPRTPRRSTRSSVTSSGSTATCTTHSVVYATRATAWSLRSRRRRRRWRTSSTSW